MAVEYGPGAAYADARARRGEGGGAGARVRAGTAQQRPRKMSNDKVKDQRSSVLHTHTWLGKQPSLEGRVIAHCAVDRLREVLVR